MHAGVQRTHSRVFGAGTVECMGEVYSHADRKLSMLGKSTVMVPRNPAFRQKAPGIRGVCGAKPHDFFYFFLFFPCKNHLIQVKDSQ